MAKLLMFAGMTVFGWLGWWAFTPDGKSTAIIFEKHGFVTQGARGGSLGAQIN
jgi:hypothetical protein